MGDKFYSSHVSNKIGSFKALRYISTYMYALWINYSIQIVDSNQLK